MRTVAGGDTPDMSVPVDLILPVVDTSPAYCFW